MDRIIRVQISNLYRNLKVTQYTATFLKICIIIYVYIYISFAQILVINMYKQGLARQHFGKSRWESFRGHEILDTGKWNAHSMKIYF